MEVTKVTRKIGSKVETHYEINGVCYNSIVELLQIRYKNQGYAYKDLFGIPYEDAEAAGWHPQDRDFDEYCSGWEKAIKDNFCTKPGETHETVNLAELVVGKVTPEIDKVEEGPQVTCLSTCCSNNRMGLCLASSVVLEVIGSYLVCRRFETNKLII